MLRWNCQLALSSVQEPFVDLERRGQWLPDLLDVSVNPLDLRGHVEMPCVPFGRPRFSCMRRRNRFIRSRTRSHLELLNGLPEVRVVDLEQFVTLRPPSASPKAAVGCELTRSIRPTRCSIDDGIQEMP